MIRNSTRTRNVSYNNRGLARKFLDVSLNTELSHQSVRGRLAGSGAPAAICIHVLRARWGNSCYGAYRNYSRLASHVRRPRRLVAAA